MFLPFKGMRRNTLLPSPPSSAHPPSLNPRNQGHNHRQLLQSFKQPSANISVKTAAQGPEDLRTDARLQPGCAAPLSCAWDDWTEAKIHSNDTKMQPDQLFWPKRCFGISASLQSSRFAMSINTQVFPARFVSRPQRGVRPTRWLQGPFLFLNHLILHPLRRKRTPPNRRSSNVQFHLQGNVTQG